MNTLARLAFTGPIELGPDVSRHISNAQSIFNGCVGEYGKAIQEKRLESWAKMCHAMVDYLAFADDK